jgi:molybdopterin molybdotransferase
VADLMFNVITVEKALKILEPYFYDINLGMEFIPIEKSLGRMISRDIIAAENIPGFSRATMDGFAVKSSDTYGASETLPAYLEIIKEIKMGEEVTDVLESGKVMKIATGGMLPSGADAVVMLEDTEYLDENTIGVLKPAAPGDNIVSKGEDISSGDILFTKNHCLRPQDIGALAAVGILKAEVWEKYKVGIISTGDELISPDEKLVPGKIRNINSYTLCAYVEQLGAVPNLYGIIKDDFAALQKKVEIALSENDIVIISGGSSVGTRDYTLEVINKLSNFKTLFNGITVKPGKPAIAAGGKGKLLFGLPGHPVSVTVAFNLLVKPILKRNLKTEKINKVKAVITRSVPSTPGRENHINVKLYLKNNTLYAEPVLGKSALINTLIKSDGEVVIQLGKEGVNSGDIVYVELFEGGK